MLRDGVGAILTEKNGGEVALPILPTLQATVDAGPTRDLAFICGERGQPLTKENFGNLFRVACHAAKVNKSAHGIRKIGATVAEFKAIFAWHGAP